MLVKLAIARSASLRVSHTHWLLQTVLAVDTVMAVVVADVSPVLIH